MRKLTIVQNANKTTLLRWGGEQRHTVDDLARIMKKIWEKTGKQKPTAQQYGLLIGLARDWPYPYAPDLFRTGIDNWSVFMSGVKIQVELGKQVPVGAVCVPYSGRFRCPCGDAFNGIWLLPAPVQR